MKDEVMDFFDEYGVREWDRLDTNIYSRITYLLHLHFLEQYLHIQSLQWLTAANFFWPEVPKSTAKKHSE